MGYMDAGVWHTGDPPGRIRGGHYVRPQTQFRDHISADGSSGFNAEAGRYHLYVAHACPWAHRTMMVRALKGLEDVVTLSFVQPLMLENGWELEAGSGPVAGARHMHDVYRAADAGYSGRCSVPVLWDRERRTIVSNESADIVRMLNRGFGDLAARPELDLYPPELHAQIDAMNDLVYHNINNGVYKCGFATGQDAYEEHFVALFDALDQIEAVLAVQRYLCGSRITEADWRLFATLIRFDAVYVGHFKCNRQRIADFPNLANYTRELYQWPGIAATFDLDKTKQHYYGSHETINPRRIIPLGPRLDFYAAHDRARLPASA